MNVNVYLKLYSLPLNIFYNFIYASIFLSLSAFILEAEQFKLSPQHHTQIMPHNKKTREEWKGGTEACKNHDFSEWIWALNAVHFLI